MRVQDSLLVPPLRAGALAALLLVVPAWAAAQLLPGLQRTELAQPAPAAPSEPSAEAADSPRASARAFTELADVAGDYQRAARYLALPPEARGRGPVLARRLVAVFERRLDVDLDALSPLSEGATDDGLPPGVDRMGEIPDGGGGMDPVFLVRSRDAEGGYWAFSRQTVARIDGWYDALPDRWVREWVPQGLQRQGPSGLLWWQWLAVPLLVALALTLGRLLGAVTRSLLARLAARTATLWDERILDSTGSAITLLWGVVVATVVLPWMALLPGAERAARALLAGIATLAAFWAIWRSVDVWVLYLSMRPGIGDNPSARSIVALLRNFAKAFVALGAALATLAAFGYQVTTVLAGLGIGGIALAFGAQKTVENMFGSVALAVDQPFRLGDFVKVQDFVGNVERIGMRSTQIRTLDRTLISIPNGQLSEMRIEDFASRDRIRFACTVGVVYGTTETQMQRILAGMEAVLRDHPKIWSDTVVVRFAGFGASSLDIEVLAWFLTSDFNEFRDYRQDALLGFMRVVESEGSSFAFPTRTVHLVTGSAPGAGSS